MPRATFQTPILPPPLLMVPLNYAKLLDNASRIQKALKQRKGMLDWPPHLHKQVLVIPHPMIPMPLAPLAMDWPWVSES